MTTRQHVPIEVFKAWLSQFDTNGDGRLSRRELQEAIRRRGAMFAGTRAWLALRNGYVNLWDTEHLIELGEKLGFMVTTRGPSLAPKAYFYMPTERLSPSPSTAPATACTPPPAATPPLHFPQHIHQLTHPSPSTGPNSGPLVTQHLATTDLLLRLLPRA